MNKQAENICADFRKDFRIDLSMFEDFPDIMTVDDLQKALGIGRTLAYRLINSGKIKYLRIGRVIKIPKQYLIDFVVQSCYNDNTAMGNLPCHVKGGQ